MTNKLKLLTLALVMLVAPLAPMVRAQTQPPTAERTTQIKSEVTKRLSKQKTKVKIKLQDGSDLKARIIQAGENSFTVAEDKTGKQTEIAYDNVASVKGRGMSTGLKIGIIAGAAVVTVAIIGVIAVKSIDPFEGGIFR